MRAGDAARGIARAYVRWSMSHHRTALAILAGVTVIALLPIRGISLDPDLGSLLPSETPSVMLMEETDRRIGGSDLFGVIVKGKDPRANARAADFIAGRVEHWPETLWVISKRDLDPLRRRFLALVPPDGIASLARVIEERIDYEAASRSGALLDDGPPPDLAAEAERILRMASPPGFPMESEPPAGIEELRDRLMSRDGRVAAVLARMDVSAMDMGFARSSRARMAAIVADLPDDLRGRVTAAVKAAYDATREYDIVARDATIATIISLVAMIVLVLAYFGTAGAVPTIMVPLATGIAWTLGFIAIFYPKLNTITAFIFGILLGMGIDCSIHLAMRFRIERRAVQGPIEAMIAAMEGIAPGLVGSVLTTVVALLALRLGHFRGFVEFGTMAAVGMVLCLAASLLVIPPLTMALGVDPAPAGGSQGSGPRRRSGAAGPGAPGPGLAWAGLALAAIFTAAAGHRGSSIEFERDFRNLRAQGSGDVADLESAIGVGRANAVILMGRSEEQMRWVHGWLAGTMGARASSGREPLVTGFVTIASVLPTVAEQEERLVEIRKLRKTISLRALDKVHGPERVWIDRLREAAAMDAPMGFQDLPPWIADMFREKDGRTGAIAYVYPAVERWDLGAMARLRAVYGRVDTPWGPVRGTTFVMLDVVETVMRDSGMLATVSIACIMLVLLLHLKRVGTSVLCIASLLAGIVWTIAFLQITGGKLGVYNMLVIPTLLGTGIDGSIHLLHRWDQIGGSGWSRVREALASTGVAMSASSVTTAAGFSGLTFSQHPGLRSIGWFAVPGVLLTMVAVMTIMGLALATRDGAAGRIAARD